ncbi:HAL/PAL/TAL family ammonia-lyase [Rubrimonas cliftonensis]|uniref:Histidine ammonia-lyase n=1 Tax=Rubrimonas cliftonensis TaxID=89524 RepID=A0A1H4AP20_9RHOB|nr:aromatic amino acid ammonia-lyase [Rubrimonas cliftonensis]SEA37414.1 histidine ammonia-lyase [Rubrimonas cliftonensis]
MNTRAPEGAFRTPFGPVTIDGATTPAEVAEVAHGLRSAALSPRAREAAAAAHARMAGCIEERRLVYGVCTGFGPLADRITAPEDIETLQENLINHLATGVGRPLSWAAARAMTLARLSSIAQGWSGASEEAIGLLEALICSRYAPRVPEKGTVGASGDLTPLSHMALALMGRGGFIRADGSDAPDAEVFAALGRPPLTLRARDGLALVNGTSAMTGVACLNAAAAARLIAWAEALTVGAAELLSGRLEAWSAAFSEARPHPGQALASAELRRRAAGAARLDAEPASLRRIDAQPAGDSRRADRAAQDAYTLRCAPQVIGAVRDAATWHETVVRRELNSATDNPIFPVGGPPALHGGNFMGQHVAFASDALNTAMIALAGLAERQVARLTDERLNGGLPAFLHRGPAGLNSGLMGAQVTATALLAEMRTRATPASAQSISTNGANQDVVSMGTIAARNAAAQIEDAGAVLAILALAVAQGGDILAERGEHEPRLGPASRAVCAWVRATAPEAPCDRPFSPDIAALAEAMAGSDPPG